jgi:Ca2+-binding RTX toxin-like protein
MHGAVIAALGVAGLLLAAPMGADAATARQSGSAVFFEASPGEANAVTVVLEPNQVTMIDRGPAELVPGPGCTRPDDADPQRVTCFGSRFSADLGDGADTLTGRSSGQFVDVVVTGGEGADAIDLGDASFWRSDVRVDGGPGDDMVAVVAGQALGGDGDDRLAVRAPPGAPGSALTPWRSVDGDPLNTCRLVPMSPDAALAAHVARLADGGPGNDTLTATGDWNWLRGGPGDDHIQGGGADTIEGGEGPDVIDAGSGRNTLAGGDGADLMRGGPDDDFFVSDAGADLITGGAGTDEVCLYQRSTGATVDLHPDDGAPLAPASDHVIAAVERLDGTRYGDVVTVIGSPRTIVVTGGGDDRIAGGGGSDKIVSGFGSDVITGGAGNDLLHGGREEPNVARQSLSGDGDDVIDGGPGRDALTGGGGSDYLDGGPGPDSLDVVDGRFQGVLNHSPVIAIANADQAWCGTGFDSVKGDYGDGVAGDCEVAEEGTPRWRPVRLRRDGTFDVRPRCAWKESTRCRGPARLVAAVQGRVSSGATRTPATDAPSWCRPLARPERLLAHAALDLRAGRVGHVSLRLTDRGQALVARRGCVPMRVIFEVRDRSGRRFGSSRTLALMRRGFRPSRPSGKNRYVAHLAARRKTRQPEPRVCALVIGMGTRPSARRSGSPGGPSRAASMSSTTSPKWRPSSAGCVRPAASAMNWSPMSMNAMRALRLRSSKSKIAP